jgi:hypothetical protein
VTAAGESDATGGHRFIVLVAGLIIMALLLLPPVRSALNRIPYLWHVAYPALTLIAGYLVGSAVLTREPVLVIVKWALLLVGAAAITVYTYGGPSLLFAVGRWSAILFILAEVVDVARGATAGPPQTGGA